KNLCLWGDLLGPEDKRMDDAENDYSEIGEGVTTLVDD
ncbi:unnamed protein product, partial [Amoebophrya sp. A25]